MLGDQEAKIVQTISVSYLKLKSPGRIFQAVKDCLIMISIPMKTIINNNNKLIANIKKKNLKNKIKVTVKVEKNIKKVS